MEEARAFKDGVDFYVPKKDTVISARRTEKGEIEVKKLNHKEILVHPIQTLEIIVIIMVVATVLSFILNMIDSERIRTLIILAVLWLGLFAYYFYKSKKKKCYSAYRYHAAEHKALNYLDRYNELPSDISFLMNTPSYSVRCGSTMIAVVCAIITLFTLSILFLPFIWLKVIGCILSLIIVFLLWAFECLNFFQKYVIKEPTWEEVEVVYAGLKEYVKEIKKGSSNDKKGSI